MEKEFIIGICEEGILVGCVSTESKYFSFSTDIYTLADVEEIREGFAVDYMQSYLEEGIEHYIINLLSSYYSDIKSISEDIVDNMDDTDLLNFVLPDVNYKVGEINIKDSEYMLELVSCGQIDFREFNQLTEKNKEFNDFVYNLWKEYHLVDNEKIPTEKLETLEQYVDTIKDYDIEIEEYIKDNLELLEELYII